jgi:hypothetical protein
MDTPKGTMILWVKYRDKKNGGESRIRFVIEDKEAIRDIVQHMRSKRLKITSYGIEQQFPTKAE